MYLVLAGDIITKEYAEEIRKYYSYRGTACVTIDFEEVLGQLHDSVILTLANYIKNFAPAVRMPLQANVFDDPKDLSLLKVLRDWVESKVEYSGFSRARADKTSERWRELNMHHILIIYGNMNEADVRKFPDSYRVYLKGKEGHPLLSHFDDCAVGNIFDLVVDTGKIQKEAVADLVGTSLHHKLLSSITRDKDHPETASAI